MVKKKKKSQVVQLKANCQFRDGLLKGFWDRFKNNLQHAYNYKYTITISQIPPCACAVHSNTHYMKAAHLLL